MPNDTTPPDAGDVQRHDLTGRRFGAWRALERVEGKGQARWQCECDCGTRRVLHAHDLKRGTTRSCGCQKAAFIRAKKVRHGHSAGRHGIDSPTYQTWRSMMLRCYTPSAISYSRYGARGISVCDRWKDFAVFLADMGERPAGKTLDRIDGSGNYEPHNCRWATPREQSRNTKSVKLTIEKAAAILSEVRGGARKRHIAKKYGVSESVVHNIFRERIWVGAAALLEGRANA